MHTRSCIETLFCSLHTLPKQYQGLFLGGKVLEHESSLPLFETLVKNMCISPLLPYNILV